LGTSSTLDGRRPGKPLERGPEGVVAKRLDGRYVPGERGWVKTKNRETWWRYELEREQLTTRQA
jgi:ATP-dependent DNA ligase